MKGKYNKLLITMIMVLFASGVFCCTETNVHATSKTANEGIAWAQSQLGKKVGSGQCVAFVQAYYSFLGVSPSSGDGQDYATNTLPAGWSRVQGGTPQKGDILVYSGVSGVQGASVEGHVAIYESDNCHYHQNFSGQYVERVTYKYNGLKNPYWGYIRPNWASERFNYNIDELKNTKDGLYIAGWAYDKQSTSSQAKIHVYVGGPAGGGVAGNNLGATNITRTDVNNTFGISGAHGFNANISTTLSGTQTVYIYALTQDESYNELLTTRTLVVGNNPTGSFDEVKSVCSGVIYVRGWSYDPDNTGKSNTVHVYVGAPAGSGGEGHNTDVNNEIIYADKYRSDVHDTYQCGNYHGFEVNIPTSKTGTQTVYVYGINLANGTNVLLGSKTVTVSTAAHTFNSGTVTKPATCTSAGQKSVTCTKCGYKSTASVPATGHQHTEIRNEKPATCTEDGYTGDSYCSDCDTLLETGQVITASGHKYGDWTTTLEATCTEKGSREKICEKCGDKVVGEISAKGHTWDTKYTVDKEATCKEEGLESIHCTVCGAIKEGSERTIEKSSHDYGDWTRKDDIYHQRVCKNDDSHVETEKHKWDNGTTTKPATETENGVMTYKCTVCDATKEETIPSLTHTHQLTKVAEKKATCTEDGNIEYWKCTSCQKIFSDPKLTAELHEVDVITPAAGHKTETRGAKKATCTEDGYSGDQVCSVCEETIKSGTVIPATGHTVVVDPAVEATTTSTGLTEGSHCSVCGEVIKKQEIIPRKTGGTTEKEDDTKPAATTDPNHPSVEAQEKKITSQKGDGDPKGSTYGILSARVKKSAKTTNTLAWNKVKGASGYIIYGNCCGTKYRYKKMAEVKKTSYVHKKLKKGTYYKYLVVAYKNASGKKTVIATSKTMHAATTGGKVGNCKKLTLNKTKVSLKKNKTFKIKAKEVAYSKKLKIKRHRKISFESGNTKIATVSSAGKIKAVKKGSCKIYVYAQNGIYKIVKVTVK